MAEFRAEDDLAPFEPLTGNPPNYYYYVSLKEGTRILDHLRWISKVLNLQTDKPRAIAKEIGLVSWQKGFYEAVLWSPLRDNDCKIIRSCPEVVKVVCLDPEAGSELMISRRQPIRAKWTDDVHYIGEWRIEFKDENYTMREHWRRIHRTWPLAPEEHLEVPPDFDMRLTGPHIPIDEIRLALTDPNVKAVYEVIVRIDRGRYQRE